MRVGLTLSGDRLSEEGARYAAQLGVNDVVVHLTDYARNSEGDPYREGVGPINGECIDAPLWSYERMADIVAMLRSPRSQDRGDGEYFAEFLVGYPAGRSEEIRTDGWVEAVGARCRPGRYSRHRL